MKIHGGTKSNKRPALDGLYHTVSKKCKTSVLGDYILSNSKVTNYVIKQCKRRQLAEFECSKDNILRSIPLPNHMYFETDFKVFKMYFQYLNTIFLYFNTI